VPGVTAAAAGFVTPVSSMAWMLNVAVPGYTPTSERDARSFFNAVSPDYLRTVGTPLIAGRDFIAADRSGAPRVAIVNQAFADKFLPGRNPIGTTFQSGTAPRQQTLTIVGLAATAKYRYMREEQSAAVLVPIAQQTSGFFNNTVYVRTDLAPSTLTSAATAAVAEVNPDVILRFRPLTDVVGAALLTERVIATLSGFFGVLALLLAMVGLYGVMSYAVARRRNEIGVRMALGAIPARVLTMVMKDVGVVTLGGIVVGTAIAMASGKIVASLLYGLAPNDATTLTAAAAGLAAAAAIAGYLPARRAASLDPMRALREE
jgi:predicted permease